MITELADIIIDVTALRKTAQGQIYGFEVKPKDGTPWHSGYIEACSWTSAVEIIYGAWKSNTLEKYTTNLLEL